MRVAIFKEKQKKYVFLNNCAIINKGKKDFRLLFKDHRDPKVHKWLSQHHQQYFPKHFILFYFLKKIKIEFFFLIK